MTSSTFLCCRLHWLVILFLSIVPCLHRSMAFCVTLYLLSNAFVTGKISAPNVSPGGTHVSNIFRIRSQMISLSCPSKTNYTLDFWSWQSTLLMTTKYTVRGQWLRMTGTIRHRLCILSLLLAVLRVIEKRLNDQVVACFFESESATLRHWTLKYDDFLRNTTVTYWANLFFRFSRTLSWTFVDSFKSV